MPLLSHRKQVAAKKVAKIFERLLSISTRVGHQIPVPAAARGFFAQRCLRVKLLGVLCVMGLAACSSLPTKGPSGAAAPPAPKASDTATPPAGGTRSSVSSRRARSDSLPVLTLPAFSAAEGDRQSSEMQNNLWERIRRGFSMPELNSDLVTEKEQFYLKKPEYLARMFARADHYLYYIVEEIERRQLPMELALLPFIESAMNPVARSPASAVGLWQFIPSTGRAFNLQQNWWVDSRRDVVQSTQAALDYLQKIYEMNGKDWFLALASYNYGEGGVARAVKRNLSRGLPTDYQSLTLPKETRHYVPKLLALKNIVLNANSMGVSLPPVPNRPYFLTIDKTDPIDLKLAAKFADMTVPDFVALNPAHNRPVITASRGNKIKLPADRIAPFFEAMEAYKVQHKSLTTWQPHTLQAGDSLESIAKRAGISTAELRGANDFKPGQRIIAGSRLLAPVKATARPTQEALISIADRIHNFEGPRVYELVDKPATYHRVRRSETLSKIATRYGASIAKLREWNRLPSGSPGEGALLVVRPPRTQTLLTTEDGGRRVVAVNDNQPRVIRATVRSGGDSHLQNPNSGKIQRVKYTSGGKLSGREKSATLRKSAVSAKKSTKAASRKH